MLNVPLLSSVLLKSMLPVAEVMVPVEEAAPVKVNNPEVEETTDPSQLVSVLPNVIVPEVDVAVP